MIRAATVHDDLVSLAAAGDVTGLRAERARELLDVATRDGDALVYLDHDRVIGFVLTTRRAFFGLDFIKLLVVSPSRRREGVGAALVDAAVAAARTERVFTSTNESNAVMRALLERDGWRKSGVLDGLDPGDPEWVYWRATSPLR